MGTSLLHEIKMQTCLEDPVGPRWVFGVSAEDVERAGPAHLQELVPWFRVQAVGGLMRLDNVMIHVQRSAGAEPARRKCSR